MIAQFTALRESAYIYTQEDIVRGTPLRTVFAWEMKTGTQRIVTTDSNSSSKRNLQNELSAAPTKMRTVSAALSEIYAFDLKMQQA